MIWHSNPRTDHGTVQSQVSRHGDVHRHFETRKRFRNADAGDSGEHGLMAHTCKSDEHVGVSNISQASDDGFSFIFSET